MLVRVFDHTHLIDSLFFVLLAVLVLVEFLEVGAYEPVGVAPYRLHETRPGIADADVARLAASGLDLVAVDGHEKIIAVELKTLTVLI